MGLTTMNINRINIKEINYAIKRHLNKKVFEDRILEHPVKALERTSFKNYPYKLYYRFK